MSSTSNTTNPSIATPKTDEPASQWARSTLSAIDPKTESQSVPSTSSPHDAEKITHTDPIPESPGVNVPGAFPGSYVQTRGTEQDTQYVKDALATAKGFAYNAGETAKGYAQSAGETVGGYIPPSVAAYLPGSLSKASPEYSLPSQETSQNEHPSSAGGVGTLPGPANESSVALLPDERMASSTGVSPITTTTNNNSVTSPPSSVPQPAPEKEINKGGIPETMRSETSMGKLPEERRQENLPSHDDESGAPLGKTAGVGILPGPMSEAGIAKLPEERAHPQGQASSVGTGTDGASTDATTRSLTGSQAGRPSYLVPATGTTEMENPHLTHSPEETHPPHASSGPTHFDAPKTTGREHPLAADEEKTFATLKKASVDTATVTPAQIASDVATPGHEHPPAEGQAVKGPVAGGGAGGLAGAGAQIDEVPERKKSGFMDKLKGEMKVISGKLAHNEEKVEAGRKMMGKN